MVEWTHTFCSQHILDFSEANPTANIKESTWGFQRAFFPARFTQTLVSKECADLASALVCAKVCSLCILSPSIYTHKNAGFHETARLAKNVRIKKYICKPGLSRKVAQLKLQVYIYISLLLLKSFLCFLNNSPCVLCRFLRSLVPFPMPRRPYPWPLWIALSVASVRRSVARTSPMSLAPWPSS